MKSRVLIPAVVALCALFMCAETASAQSFTVEWTDPSPMTRPAVGTIEHHGLLTNTSDRTINVRFRYNGSGQFFMHGVNLCFGILCYELSAHFDDPNLRDAFVMEGKASSELKTQLLTAGAEGTSTLRFNIYDSDNPTDSIPYAVTIIASNAASIVELSDVAFVEVGPNPATDRATITSPMLTQAIGVDVYSSDGRILRSQSHDGTERVSINVSTLPVGSYHVILTLASGAIYRTPITVVR